MFAYCGNNPVMAVDPSGDIWLPFYLLLQIGFIHYRVQDDIVAKYGFSKEITIPSAGRADLKDASGGLYEVKPATYENGFRLLIAYAQLLNYVENSDYHIGTQNVSGSFVCCEKYIEFEVNYYTIAPGLILYTFSNSKKSKEKRDVKNTFCISPSQYREGVDKETTAVIISVVCLSLIIDSCIKSGGNSRYPEEICFSNQ